MIKTAILILATACAASAGAPPPAASTQKSLFAKPGEPCHFVCPKCGHDQKGIAGVEPPRHICSMPNALPAYFVTAGTRECGEPASPPLQPGEFVISYGDESLRAQRECRASRTAKTWHKGRDVYWRLTADGFVNEGSLGHWEHEDAP